MGTMTTQIRPPHDASTPDVTVPAHRVLKVAAFTTEETGTFYAPVSASANDNGATKAPEQTEKSVAKTVRPARRRAVA